MFQGSTFDPASYVITATLAGVAEVCLKKLQSVQNMAACMVTGARRCDREDLHWLSVSHRVVFKTALVVWKCIHGVAPAYLSDLYIPAMATPGPEKLRSLSSRTLLLRRIRTTAGQRSFALN